MDICTAIFSVFAVVLLLALVVIVRSVYVLKRRGNNVALDKRKPVKVIVVAGSGSSCRSNVLKKFFDLDSETDTFVE